MAASAGGAREPSDNPPDSPPTRAFLSAEFLLGEDPLHQPVPTAAFSPAAGPPPNHEFTGMLSIDIRPGAGRLATRVDRFDYVADDRLRLSELPPFRYEFVQDGSNVVPTRRGPQASTHPYWEFILEPGQAWTEPGDAGWTRVALPFALQERNANCTHNGVMTFLFRGNGEVSRVAYQVGSETCQYLQIDLWGTLPASFRPGAVANAKEVAAAHRQEVAIRLPVKPLQALAADYPGAEPSRFDWFPPDEVSTFGFAIDGVHYSGGCNTRYGPYPFCAVMDLPSYSLAKAIFAGTAYLMLEQSWPGAGEQPVTEWVPECRQDGRWEGVTLQHLLDMTTGNYESTEPDVDEFASYETDFMAGETHAQKINTACTLFPRKAEPGTTFAYHTSDSYIAGTLMNAFLKHRAGADRDIHRDVLVGGLFEPLMLSPVSWTTRRTYDAVAQPFTGWGLTLHSDDIVRLGLFLTRSEGRMGLRQALDMAELEAALQRRPDDTGIGAGSPELRYNNGFWAHATDLKGACDAPVWIPFLSGYGGISVALLPNGTLFYVFSDKGRFEWLSAAIESNRIRNFCDK
jgi:hypothetical protein